MRYFATLNNLWDDKADAVGRNGESYATCWCIELWINGSQGWDTNQVALHIDERTTAVTRVDGSIGLKGIRQICAALSFRDCSVKGTHNTIGDGLGNAQWVADCQYILSHFEL